MKIEKIHANNLRNDAHFQFHTEFRDLAAQADPPALKIAAQFASYLALYEREDEALKKINKSGERIMIRLPNYVAHRRGMVRLPNVRPLSEPEFAGFTELCRGKACPCPEFAFIALHRTEFHTYNQRRTSNENTTQINRKGGY